MSGEGGVVWLWSPHFLKYDFGDGHPMQPRRLEALFDLAVASGHLVPDQILTPAPASDALLGLIHDDAYVAAVRRLSLAPDAPEGLAFGFDPEETPAFMEMHEASALIAGATVAAVEAVVDGRAAHAFNPAGGLHHALRGRASGFCVYNDPAIAIAQAIQVHGLRVAYVDFDAHHGDGVQQAFYDDPRVLTVSFHETGRHLFPGSGDVLEMGTGAGLGSAVNVPLEPYTDDDLWIEAVDSVLPPLIARFKPDLIVAQFGCDGHVWDPLSHLALTTRATAHAADLIHSLAHEYAGGHLVATSGGGYEALRVVPRAWMLVWAALSQSPLPEGVPGEWLERWQDRAADPLPQTWLDPPSIAPVPPRYEQIAEENRQTVARVRALAVSPAFRRAYPGPTRPPDFVPDWGPPRSHRIQTRRGPLIFSDRASASLIERLEPDPGLIAFARSPEREKALLERIASQPECNLTIAHTPEGLIVGQVSVVPPEGRWAGLTGIYEVGIELARDWRRTGLAPKLLAFALNRDCMEDLILIGLGLSWHWDLEQAGLDGQAYRRLLVRLFGGAGFSEYETDDPEIAASPDNVFLARVGSRVPHETFAEFDGRLMQRSNWWGF